MVHMCVFIHMAIHIYIYIYNHVCTHYIMFIYKLPTLTHAIYIYIYIYIFKLPHLSNDNGIMCNDKWCMHLSVYMAAGTAHI